MPAMGRRLSNVLTLLSCVLLLIVSVQWVRSYLPDHVWFRWVEGRLMVVIMRDGQSAEELSNAYFDKTPTTTGGPRSFLRQLRAGQPVGYHPRTATPPPPPFVLHRVLGIEAAAVYYFGNDPPRYRVVTIPAPYLALPLAVLPAVWVARGLRRRRRERAGRCAACGYDLRATAGRCPECGSNAAPAAA